MKTLIKFIPLLLLLIFGACTMQPRATSQAPNASVSFQLFYDELSPYGTWVRYQDYGYAWAPDVDRDFTPYGTNGHWVYTEAGWTWFSDYSWGWAPFHYGRWAFDDYYGWLWVPQNEWGPAWVTWRRSEGYYGWAPMGPGVSLELSFGGGYRVPNDRWTFVRDRDINRPDIDHVYIDRSTNTTIINTSVVINNIYVDNSRGTKYASGPGRDDVQRVLAAPITPVRIRDNGRPGQALSNDQLQIYRPRVRPVVSNDRNPAPTKPVDLKELGPASERSAGHQMRDERPAGGGRDQSVPPAVLPPPVKLETGRQEQQPPVSAPTSPKVGDAQRGRIPNEPDVQVKPLQSPVVTPPDTKIEDPQRGRTARPPVPEGKPQQSPVVTPPDTKIEDLQRGRTARPPVPEGRQQQPTVIPADKRPADAPRGRNLQLPDPQGRQQQTPAVTPIDKGRSIDQAKPRQGRVPSVKPKPRTVPPPKMKKEKVDDPKP